MIEDKLYEWVDGNPPSPDRRFSGHRAAKLLVAIVATSVLGGLPLALWEVGLRTAERGREEQQNQEQLRRQTIELEKAVRQGKAGEATRRLFGIKTPPPTMRQRPSKEVTGSGGAKESDRVEQSAAADRPRE
jgi:hypothetical protein